MIVRSCRFSGQAQKAFYSIGEVEKMDSKVRNSNMEYLDLDQAQYEEFRRLMLDMSSWDDLLDVFVRARCEKVGFSGDVLACAVADWIKERSASKDKQS